MIYSFSKEIGKYYLDITLKTPRLYSGVFVLKLIYIYFDLSYKEEKSMNLVITLLGFTFISQIGEAWWENGKKKSNHD